MMTTGHKTMMVMASAIALAIFLGVAHAQPAADALRGRVEDELLSDGISLGRLGQRLELRTRGAALEVVLTDAATGKALATRAIDKLPAEQSAAVAQLTVVVSDMLRERGLLPAGAASNWTATFAPSVVVAYHRPASVAVVAVAKPGRPGTETRAAAAALVAAYRAAGVAKVDDGRALGEVAEAEDAAIVTRAAALAVDKIAIVRAFVEGLSVRAIVTIYDANGQLITGFSAVAGQPLAVPAVPPSGEGSVASEGARTALTAPSLDKDGVVRLWVQSDTPNIQLLRTTVSPVRTSRGTAALGISSVICRAPCGVVVDGSLGEAFTFGLSEQPRTASFQLLGRRGDVTAQVKPTNQARVGAGAGLLGAGGFLVVGGGMAVLIAATHDSSSASDVKVGGTLVLLAGAAAAFGGYQLLMSGRPEVTMTPGRPK